MSRLHSALVVVLAFVVLPVSAATLAQNPYLLGGLQYFWPAVQGDPGTALTNDGAGALTWEPAEPPDIVTHTVNGTCPPGWSTFTAAQGRVIVGLVSGGTNAATVGTALSNLENRPVGQHVHSVTDGGHTHTQNAHGHSVSDPGHSHSSTGQSTTHQVYDGVWDNETVGSAQASGIVGTGISLVANAGTNQSATTGIAAVNSSGGVTGTNAPYVQYPVCQSGG